MSLALIGFKNVGKSTYGREAAKRAGCTFVDTDRLIEQLYLRTTGRLLSCREIFHTYGEKLFRMLEIKAVVSIDFSKPQIIALGGGALTNPEVIKHLAGNVRFVYMHLSKRAAERQMFKNGVPLFIDAKDPHTSFKVVWAKRDPLFSSLADIKVDMEKYDHEAVVSYITSLVHSEASHALK